MLDLDLTNLADYRSGFPHELFNQLREDGPVHRHRSVTIREDEPEVSFWSVVRHAEIQQANRDWEGFTATDHVGISPTPGRSPQLISLDPPDHTRLRRLISAGFTPRMIGKLEEHIAVRATRILDDAAAGGGDFVRDISYPLPMHVIADIVGIPEDERSGVFQRVEIVLKAIDPTTPLTLEDQHQAQKELFQYAVELTERKRTEPADDVWTLIAHAELTDDGTTHRLDGMELELFFQLLAAAGSETTRNALSQGLLALLDSADQLADLRDDPSLMPTATDEILRWTSPVLYFGRTATQDTELGGVDIAAGDRVVLWYASGNRDERAFDDPFRFDIRRSPNPHVAFGGGGPHYCLGAQLAKKEIQVLFGELFRRFDVEVLGDPEWSGVGPRNNVGVSIEHLPVSLRPR